MGVGLLTLPGSTVAADLGADVATKREDNLTELVLVDDDDDDDTNDNSNTSLPQRHTRSPTRSSSVDGSTMTSRREIEMSRR